MSQQALSPLVQVMHTPSSVVVHLHEHMAKLHWHIVMPFIMQQQLQSPSHSILHMFCSVPQATSSSQLHVIFMPPAHFSILIVHLGTMHMLGMFGLMAGMPDMGMAGPGIEPIINIERSDIIVVDIKHTPFGVSAGRMASEIARTSRRPTLVALLRLVQSATRLNRKTTSRKTGWM